MPVAAAVLGGIGIAPVPAPQSFTGGDPAPTGPKLTSSG